MKITGRSKIEDVLSFNEEKMIRTLMHLAPVFERLQYPKLRRAMAGRVSVSQAARIAHIPLAEILYVLNLAIGEDEAPLAKELRLSSIEDLTYNDIDLPEKPEEIARTSDDDENVIFVDLMKLVDAKHDPLPSVAHGLLRLKHASDILLLRHPFNPIPLRDLLVQKGYASWAEERKRGVWYIYVYRTAARAKTFEHQPVSEAAYSRSVAARR